MKKPRFSVIIPTFNEENFAPKLLRSLVTQTVKNFDVVLVDGKSKDKTLAVATPFTKKLPLTIVSSDKPGVSLQRNMGARIAQADWLIFVDADSVLMPNFMERIGDYIDGSDTKFFTTWMKADGDNPAEAIAGFLANMFYEGALLIERPCAPGPMTVVRRDVFNLVGGYDEEASYGEDYDFTLQVVQKGVPLTMLREILYEYSLRRFRKEGTFKAFNRYLKSTLKILITKSGPKHMPGFIGGGAMYGQKKAKKRTNALFLKKLQKSIRKIAKEFVS